MARTWPTCLAYLFWCQQVFSGTLRLAYEILLLGAPEVEVSTGPSIILILSLVHSAAETSAFAWAKEEMKFCALFQTMGICSWFVDPAAR